MTESISQLPAATGANLTDLVPATQGSSGPLTGTTRGVTVSQLLATPFISTGSNTPRTLANRFADVINVLDWLTAGQPDGTTDNTTQLQAAITAGAGKAIVWLPKTASNYVISAALTIPSNTHVVIDGYILLKAGSTSSTNPNLASSLIWTQSTTNVTITGMGTLDGNIANMGTQLFCGIVVMQCTTGYVSGLTTLNTPSSGINIAQSSDVIVDNCKMLNAGFANQFTGVNFQNVTAAVSNNCWIRNCYINGTNDYGFSFYDGVTNSGITGCLISNSAQVGIGVLSDGGTLYANNVVIDGNICFGNTVGISSTTAGGLTGVHTNITIANNQCYSNTDCGIKILATTGVSINNNNLSINASSGSGNGGINMSTGCSVYTISNNTIRGNFNQSINCTGTSYGTIIGNSISNGVTGSGNPGRGIFLSTSPEMLITDNQIFDDQVTPTMTEGITGTLGVATVISSNQTVNIATPYNITTVSDSVVQSSFDALANQTTQSISANAQTIAVGAFGSVILTTTTGANMTGMILAAGRNKGQTFTIINTTAFTITFAASGTSHVFGTPVQVANLAQDYVWDGTNSLWRQKA